MEDPGLFTLPCRLGDSKPFDTLADIGSCVNIIPLYLLKKLNIGLLEETDHIFGRTRNPFLVGRGFLATANEVIDCRMAKIVVKGITSVLEDDRILERHTINLRSNMWESKDLIKNPINWDKPPKNRDGAWHAKIRLIDPDGEEFTKTLQSIPTTRKLSERESPEKIMTWTTFSDT
ncbi:hypothetical protein Tco_0128350 [Tanacetum coccineum]